MLGGGVGGGATAQTQNFPNVICRVAPWRPPMGRRRCSQRTETQRLFGTITQRQN